MYAYVAGIKKNPDDTPFRIENAQRQRYLSLIYAHFMGVLNEKRCKTSHFVCSHCAIHRCRFELPFNSFIGNVALISLFKGVYISSFTDTIII